MIEALDALAREIRHTRYSITFMLIALQLSILAAMYLDYCAWTEPPAVTPSREPTHGSHRTVF